MARYCGPACQRHDWPIHRKVCRSRAEVRYCVGRPSSLKPKLEAHEIYSPSP
ncbi:hypothetical protein GGR52DRAFT_539894, partial [Hypoxylon sp. FL1284]